jgi:hypothetical protein
VFEPSTEATAEGGHIRCMVSSSRLISCDDCNLHLGVQKAQTVSSVLAAGNQSVCRVVATASCTAPFPLIGSRLMLPDCDPYR